MAQDDKGFMWFGTRFGLYRYDGYNFKVFVHEPGNPNSLDGVVVKALFKDRDGVLWVGCDQFLDKFDRTTETFTRYPIPFVTHISQDAGGTLWLATPVGGLYGLDPATGRIRHYSHDPNDPLSLSSNDVIYSGEDKESRFWVATNGYLDEFDRRAGKVTRHIQVPDAPLGFGFYEDRVGVFWIFHVSPNPLAVFDRKTNTLTHYAFPKREPTVTRVTGMLEDRNGALWIATHGLGLLKFDRDHGRFIRYHNLPGDPDSLPQDDVDPLLTDREGTIWAGLGRMGPVLFATKPQPFKKLPKPPGSTIEPFVGALYEDRQGILWIGTPEALNRLDHKTGRLTSYRTGRPDVATDVVSIREDRSGNLWVGTYGHGLHRFDRRTGQFKTYRHNPADPHSLSNNIVMSLLVDDNGTLWAGTYDGLNRFDAVTERFTTYKLDPERNLVYLELVEDRAEALWIGTERSGLRRFDPATGQLTIYEHTMNRPGTLSDNRVNSVHLDRSGTIWVGTQNGLDKLDPKTGRFSVYTQRDGLPGNAVGCVLEDDQANLWMSTNNGVARFNLERNTFTNFSTADGLPGPNLTGWGACSQSPHGEMFFGGFNGGTSFFPAKVLDASYVPPIVLTDFRLSGNPVEIGGHSPLQKSIPYARDLILPYQQNVFSLTFAALSYVNPATNRYRYKLEGLERQWNVVGSDRRQATYTTLPAGTYTFRAQGATSSGSWSDPGVALRIEILPPWWGTLSFRLASAGLILGTLWLLYRLRIRTMEERERQFRKLAENAPDIVMRFEPDLRYSYVNAIVEEYTGLPPKALLGKTNREVGLFEKHVRSWEAGLQQVFETGQVTIKEFTFNTPKGERRLESRLVPELGVHDSTDSVLVITRDITDRKQAEEKLRRSEAYLAEAQKLSQTGSFGWDVSSGEIYWSRETFQIFEYEPTDKVTIELVLQRTHPDDRSAVQQLIERVSRERKEFDFEHRLLMPDGSIKHLRVIGRPSREESGCLEFVGAVTDITERKRAEEVLRNTQAELAHVTRVMAMGEIAASIAHEIKQPLSGVEVNATACLRWLAGDLPNLVEAREAVQRIKRDGKRAGDVIARIRALATKRPTEKERLDLNETIEETVALVQDLVRRNKVTLRMDLGENLPPLLGDRVQLQQVVLNLIMNGIEAMSKAGSERRELVITTREGVDRVEVAVRDSGVGVDSPSLQKIFDAFYTTKPGGMGMGLSISRTIVHSHGGQLWATTNDGPGLTLHFTVQKDH